MKIVLRIALFLAVLNFSTGKTVQAQCKVSEFLIQNLVPSGPSAPGTCTATFDLSFTMQANNGNKYVFVHVFPESNYPDYFDCVNGSPSSNGAIQPPKNQDLANGFINIGIDNSGPVPLLLTGYPPDGSVVLNAASSVTSTMLPNGSISFVVHNIIATLPADCNAPFLMLADLWSSNSAAANVAQCTNCHIEFALNFMSATGFANCANLTYSTNLTNRIGLPLGGYYRVYADVNHDGILSLASDILIKDTTSFALAAGVGSTFLINGTIPPVNINQDLFVVIKLTSGVGAGSVIILKILTTTCIVLPVNFGSFSANRTSNNSVILKWETLTEINNYGFYIERSIGNGVWINAGFVPSQSANSNTLLNYSFTDMNTIRGISQYRIRQVNIDGRVTYSGIRTVRGYTQGTGMLVYPNPGYNGMVNIVFDNKEGMHSVILSDTYGRIIQQWKDLSADALQITSLGAGVYIVRVENQNDGSQTSAKIVMVDRK